MSVGRGGRVALRFLVSAGLLVGLARALDGDVLVRRLTALDPTWVVVGLAISLPQMALLAVRWRITAARLGLELPFTIALREYYLGTFLNQVLPGGVMGDVSRAWRHGHTASGFGPAVRAVILERASGQIVMAFAAALALLSLPVAGGARGRSFALVAGGAVILVTAVLVLRRVRVVSSAWGDLHRALLARDVIGVQLVTSGLVLATYVAMYLAAARAVGLPTPFATLVPLVPPVLLSMLIPITIAGWGVREAAAAGIWSMVGLTAEDGVAASAAYGLLVLASTMPGALFLFSAGRRAARSGGRDQTVDRRPDGSGDTVGGAPGQGSPRAEG